tara:strand:+ start:4587 stop:5051 length:465 start_codon:yes stop_codon:yes gene_type:complete
MIFPNKKYNKKGNLSFQLESNGDWKLWKYDSSNNIIKEETSDGIRTENTYYKTNGKVYKRYESTTIGINRTQYTTKFYYDEQGRYSRVEDTHGRIMTFQYENGLVSCKVCEFPGQYKIVTHNEKGVLISYEDNNGDYWHVDMQTPLPFLLPQSV